MVVTSLHEVDYALSAAQALPAELADGTRLCRMLRAAGQAYGVEVALSGPVRRP